MTRTIETQCKLAFEASTDINNLDTATKNKALEIMASSLISQTDFILKENEKDIAEGIKNNLTPSLIDRLKLSSDRIKNMSDGLMVIKNLDDPIGQIISEWDRPNGLEIQKIRVPLGVIGIIYEARPNVTADAIGLCIKTGNAIVLRGSSSAQHSNKAIAKVLTKALEEAGANPNGIQLLDDTSREGVIIFSRQTSFINLIIPRGGAALIRNVVENSLVPTIETGVGLCHVYIDKTANIDMSKSIVINAKVQRPSVCNSCETLLIHKDIYKKVLPTLSKELIDLGVELRGDQLTCELVKEAHLATEEDWKTEYLDLILSIKIVDSLEDALKHIHVYGTKHTEVIVSQDKTSIDKFKQKVDATTVISNASSRFTDGGEFGFGAELGISTQKIHARGPMGLAELTSWKYLITGTGQVRG